jgi:hypothetical protein
MEGFLVPASRRLRTAPIAPSILAVLILAVPTVATVAFAAGRIERPATDATPQTPAVAPRPPLVFAPSGRPWILDPANPMREISPGVYEGIVPVRLADGSWRVDLDERFMQFSVARRAEGGGLAHACVAGFDGLSRWHAAGAGCSHAAPKPVTPTVSAAAVQPQVTTPAGPLPAKWEAQ